VCVFVYYWIQLTGNQLKFINTSRMYIHMLYSLWGTLGIQLFSVQQSSDVHQKQMACEGTIGKSDSSVSSQLEWKLYNQQGTAYTCKSLAFDPPSRKQFHFPPSIRMLWNLWVLLYWLEETVLWLLCSHIPLQVCNI